MLGHNPLSTRPLSTVATGAAATTSGTYSIGSAGIIMVSEDPVYRRTDHARLFTMFGRQAAAAVIASTMLLFPTKAASVEAEQDTARRTDHQALHRFRTNYQTVGQPWVAIYPKPSIRIEAESYQPFSAKPFPSQIVTGPSATPWHLLWNKSGIAPQSEQFFASLNTSQVVSQQVTTVAGQPWNLLLSLIHI